MTRPLKKPKCQPLSWTYARARLRHILQKYVDEFSPSTTKEFPATNSNTNNSSWAKAWLSWCLENNVDLHAGSVLVSVALLTLACISLATVNDDESNNSKLNPQADSHVYKGQVAAAVILLLASIASIWIVRRSTFLRVTDSESAKRREIQKFLNTIREIENEMGQTTGLWNSLNPNNLPSTLSETALCDIYPVYRKVSQDPIRFLWTRLPSLMLVDGDLIALQVGDIAPADCSLLEKPGISISINQRVTIEALGQAEANLMENLPRGRTTLPENSDKLMTFCNSMQMFRVEKAPMEAFIHKRNDPSKPSQVWLKMNVIRKILLLLVPAFLLSTSFVVLVRPDATTNGDLSLSLTLPLLAALGVSPLVAPFFFFVLEVIGTARILRTVHPYAVAVEQFNGDEERDSGPARLLWDYIVATFLTRLSLWSVVRVCRDFYETVFDSLQGLFRRQERDDEPPKLVRISQRLVRVPPASLNLLEKLGVCTAFTLVDDELAYELNAIPQQLLIPSAQGLKLLDICPVYDDDEASEESDMESSREDRRERGRSFDVDVDSDSESDEENQPMSTLRQKILKRRLLRRRSKRRENSLDETDSGRESVGEGTFEVQFENPTWWHHLPALKCIGLSCLLNESSKDGALDQQQNWFYSTATPMSDTIEFAKTSLINLITVERKSHQLNALAECIGFSREPNANGERGDLTPFQEQLRMHIIDKTLFEQKLALDSHERSSEQSRWWGHLWADATAVLVKDTRAGSYQLLTAGDPQVVANLCNEAWQGEISTIMPLGQIDRQTIAETSKNWKLADLDVVAFGYAPVPHSVEKRLKDEKYRSHLYLLDTNGSQGPSVLKDKTVSRDWALIRNQVFLGVLGSLVVPRREITTLLGVLADAGVRFVYFSPRNMRRQKELASQMGIDVAWNCAISLRPLDSGEDDPHRMVSTYADWDVNAKLPHGVEEVRRHLQEVDNVPLLVSLYTDTTKQRTKEMLGVFQEYHDTVFAIGIAHLPRNDGIFAAADIAVGIDVLGYRNTSAKENSSNLSPVNRMVMAELEFVSAIASHSCAFRFRGVPSISHLTSLIEEGRASLEAASAAAVFLICSSLSFSCYVLFSACMPVTAVPFVPTIGAMVYLLLMLPLVGYSMAFTGKDDEMMKQVPPKNDAKQPFAQNEGFFLYQMMLMKAAFTAFTPQLLHLIAFGKLAIHFEPELVELECDGADAWYKVVRCEALRGYSGPARISSGIAVFSVFVMVSFVSSVSFVKRFEPIHSQPPWERNVMWVLFVGLAAIVTGIVASLAVEHGTGSALPWYFYLIAAVLPFLSIVFNEFCKKAEQKRETRAEKLRRLQFETRLGAWSPK